MPIQKVEMAIEGGNAAHDTRRNGALCKMFIGRALPNIYTAKNVLCLTLTLQKMISAGDQNCDVDRM